MLLSWPLDDQRRFFERDLAVPLTLETETGKLFPVSNSARQVRDALVSAARAGGVRIRFNAFVIAIDASPARQGMLGIEGSTPTGGTTDSAGPQWTIRLNDGDAIRAARVILASGGLSVPATGSDGLGLEIARRLGHSLHATYPALTPLLATPPVHGSLAGLSVHARLSAPRDRRVARSRGGFLFTHRGYSGPAVLDLSHVAVRALADGVPQSIHAQWSDLGARDWNDALRTPSRRVIAVLREHLPARLSAALMDEVGVGDRTTTSELRREQRHALVDRLTRYALPWTDHGGYAKAEVTGGGVPLDEVHPATLESRIAPGLFLCGEMLDAFGPIGGYNFAWAWATGRLAGLGASRPVAPSIGSV